MSPTIYGTSIQGLGLPSIILSNPATSILLPIGLGTAIGYATRPKQTQNTYVALRQPPLRPPPWLFGPVWTLLYGLMGYSIHRIYTTGTTTIPPFSPTTILSTTALYTTQLGLNLLWMPLFFGIERPELALVDILLLGVNLAALTSNYFKIDKVAGYLTIPYLAWVGFATYLNVGVGVLNNWDIRSKRIESQKKNP